MLKRLTFVGLLGLVAGCSAGKADTSITKDTVSVSSSSGAGGSGGSSEGGSSQGGEGAGGDGAGGSEMGLPPIVVVAQCDLMFGGGMWAEAFFPGKTRADLAALQTLGEIDDAVINTPPGYEHAQQWVAYVQDERAVVNCSNQLVSVTFILPSP